MSELTLRPFQEEGVRILVDSGRCMLADEMGLGKTPQAIRAAADAGISRILVICRNRLRYNWAREIRRWYPIAPVWVLPPDMADKLDIVNEYNNGFLIVNYESIRPHVNKTNEAGEKVQVDSPLFKLLNRIKWDAVIADEAHWLCNRKSTNYLGANKLLNTGHKPYYFWPLTGTYIRNRVADLWTLMHLMDPKRFSSFWDFMKRHANARPGRYGWVYENHATDPVVLSREIDSYIVQRDRAMVGSHLPQQGEPTKRWLNFDGYEEQRRIYGEMENFLMTNVIKDSNELVLAPAVVAQLTRLKQICISPKLLDPRYKEGEAKIPAMAESIETRVKMEGRKVLVFSQFAEALDLLRPYLKKAKLNFVEISGRVSDREQIEAERRLQEDPAVHGVLGVMTAAGEGLNLTAASVTMFMDKHWNPSINDQCRYRIDREGQVRDIYTEEYLMAQTIEEWIEEMLDDKNEGIQSIVRIIKDNNRCR